MSNDNTALTATRQQFDLSPQTFDQALTFSKYLADSDLVPKDFKGRPGNCLVAIQWGAELGLKPLQAMQNLAVINGRPALWGDAVIALVRSSPLCEYVVETDDGGTATCKVKRRNEPEQVRTFSMDDAKAASLAGKQGPWAQYPKRMRQMRARAFALRDVFPDVLRGLPVAEEVMDTPTEKHMGPAEVVTPAAPAVWPPEKWAETLPTILTGIKNGKTIDDALKWLGARAQVTPEQEKELRDAVAKAQKKPPAAPAAEAPQVDVVQMEADMRAATNKDALYTVASLLDAITDEAQRLRMNEVFDACVAKLEQEA